MPRFKRVWTCSVRLDPRVLADFLLHFRDRGYHPRNKSDLVCLIVEAFHTAAFGEHPEFRSLREAVDLLDSVGLVSPRAVKYLSNAVDEESAPPLLSAEELAEAQRRLKEMK